MDLKDKVKGVLEENKMGITIPKLCEIVGISDDFALASIIGELESSGEAELNGFKTVYREDGGAIHLATYTTTHQNS